MPWLRSHPYTAVLACVGIVFVVGAFFVSSRTPRDVTQTKTWESIGSISSPLYGNPAPTSAPAQPSLLQQTMQNAPYTYAAPSSTENAPTPYGSFNIDAFAALLSQSAPKPIQPSIQVDTTENPYAFAVSQSGGPPVQEDKSNPLVLALHEYGNAVGSIIQSFESSHADWASTLKAQADDRADTAKAAALTRFAGELAAVGERMLDMTDVPPEVVGTHKALGNAYVEIGTKLAAVSRAGDDDAAFLEAIQTYNASVEAFAPRYVALVKLFASYGVGFSQNEPGSVFSFTSSGSL